MGVTIEDNGQPTAAIQTVGLKTWKIGEPWSTTNGRHSVNEIIENGEPATGVLEHGSDEHCYFFQTNEGTIGKITLGAEVTNTKVVPGAATEDDLQRTVGLRRGRRMNLGYLRPIEP
ncbi:MAG: hypothetical protein KDA80_02460 [Planctomycetaceae bacterium]|nr:hypothetical protein [Planctomycetaceae bacterium]